MSNLQKAAQTVALNAKRSSHASFTVKAGDIENLRSALQELNNQCHICDKMTTRTCASCEKPRCVDCKTSSGTCLSCDEESE